MTIATNPQPTPEETEMTTPSPPIRIRGLSKSYRTTTALDGLDLDLESGQIVGLLGENGCGKTTLLKILAGVLSGYSGDVSVAGHTPGPQSKALVSFLPDAGFLAGSARVRYCMDLYRDFFADFNLDRARDLLAFFGLDESMRIKEMSKGMREKVQVTLTMSREADVFLLDEPISGVDPAARDVILDGILRNLAENSLLFISTHLVHDLEPVLDSVVMMRHGQITLAGRADDLRMAHSASLDQIFKETHR